MVKFLIIRFSSIGDIVLTTPVIRCLKQQVEDVEVHFLTKKRFSNIVESNPYVDKVHILRASFYGTVAELRDVQFDYIIDLHNNVRTQRIKSSLRRLSFKVDKLNLKKWIYVNFKKNLLPKIHIVDRYLNTLKKFDVKNDNKGLDFFIPEKEEIDISVLDKKIKSGYVAFVIAANHLTKAMTNEKTIAICKKIKQPIVLIGGKDDNERGEIISKAVGNNVINACGKFNLYGSASIVKQSNVVVTYDTGLMHIASAFKKKIISIWGNTVPDFGMYPYLPDEQSQIIQVDGLKCRPCSKIGFKKCPKKHFKCMNNIDERRIVDLVDEMF
ncbi:MAG: glycosyltransferase family 9 protein [Bacteroidetes bacterium]|nr:glycosyltransferase family 9 protein [Bacteroidota bacterium]